VRTWGAAVLRPYVVFAVRSVGDVD